MRAADLEQWRDDVCSTPPDVLLLDLTLHGEDVVADIPMVVSRCPSTMVAALTGRPAEADERWVLSAGAFTYYEKSELNGLPGHIECDLMLFRRALAGERVVAPSACFPGPHRQAPTSGKTRPAQRTRPGLGASPPFGR